MPEFAPITIPKESAPENYRSCVAPKMGFDTEIRGRLSTGSHDSPVVRGNVNKAATEALPEDPLTRIYELCIDGYKLLLTGTLVTNEIHSSLDNEYVRLQLWGIDTGILKGKLGVLRAHPLYQTAGFILQKILRRLLRLGDAYPTDDAAQATWLQRASEYILEVPSHFQATRGEEDTSGKPPEEKDHSLTVEQKVQRLHNAFWAEMEEHKAPRGQATAHNVSMEDRSKQDQAVEGFEGTGSGIELDTGSPIYPSDSASQSGIHESQVAESTSIAKLETEKPSSTVLSSGNDSSSSSVSSIVVLKVVEALTVFNNCLFSIVKEMDMAMADYGKGSLSELYAAVKVKVGETATAGKAPSIRAEDSTNPEESNIKATVDIDKWSVEPSSPPNPTSTVERSQKSNYGQVHSTPNNPSQRGVNPPEPPWHPPNITASPNFPLSPPPPSVSETLQVPQPNAQGKSESKQALPPKVSDKTNQGAPPEKRQQYTQDSTVAPTSPSPSEQSNFETIFSREKIVAAAMTNDNSLFDLMHTYADMGHDTTDVGFGLFCEKYQEVVSVPLKQPWLSLDLAMCMWKNASRVIRDKFKELAKNKLQDLKRIDDEINYRASLEPAAAVCTAYPLPVLPKESSHQRAIEYSARTKQSTPAPVYGETRLVYTGARDRRYPWSKTGSNSRDCQGSPPPPNMADFVYEITAPTSPNGSPNRGGGGGVRNTMYAGGDDRGNNHYDDRSHPSAGRSNPINEHRRAASVHVCDSRDRRDRSRPQSTSHGGSSRRPARSVRSSRSRASAHGGYHYSSSSDSSDVYATRSSSRKRSSSGHNESHDHYRESDDDYDNDDYNFYPSHVQKQSSNNSTMAPWTAPIPNPIPPNPAPPNPAPQNPAPPNPAPLNPAPPTFPSSPPLPHPFDHSSRPSLVENSHNFQRGFEASRGLTEPQLQRNQLRRRSGRPSSTLSSDPPSSHTPPFHPPSLHPHPPYAYPYLVGAQGISQAQSSETLREPPRSILRTSSLPPQSSTVTVLDSVSGENNTNTRVANYDLEHRMSILENMLASLGSPYTRPPPQFPPHPPLPGTPARKQKSVSIEDHAT
ncbi:hypothetical protein BGX38DRAFT_1266671 [Terfezia claveryi]|nr:hypothetical protein BGX38DRAFT_1266671 [Terfezia claveryi]